MTALVPELVNMASDPAVTTTDLLRRALVVTSRLNVPELVTWVKSELNGYDSDIPDYRVIYGQLMAENPYHGLIPFRITDDSIMEMICAHQECQSIPELERVLAKTSTGYLLRGFPPSQEQILMSTMSYPMRPQLKFVHSQINGIIEKVRNRILEWALDLEARGVIGEGMTFTQRERQMVQEQHIHISGVTGSQIQIGSNSSNQHQANRTEGDTTALKAVADALAIALEKSKTTGEEADELRAEIATLKAQAASPKPKWEIVKASTKSVKAIVEGAAGSVLGELAKPHVQALLGLLPS
ncbi:MAG: AbiTii domain-containing protein [Telluria sp.]